MQAYSFAMPCRSARQSVPSALPSMWTFTDRGAKHLSRHHRPEASCHAPSAWILSCRVCASPLVIWTMGHHTIAFEFAYDGGGIGKGGQGTLTVDGKKVGEG